MSINIFDNYNDSLKERDRNSIFDRELFLKNISFVSKSFENIKKNKIDYKDFFERLTELSTLNNDNGSILSLHAHLWGSVFPLIKFDCIFSDDTLIDDLMSGSKIGALTYTDSKENPVSFKETDKSFILNGEKSYITNSLVADLFLVYCDDENGHKSCFVCKRSDKGLDADQANDLMGLRTAGNGQVKFTDCEIPKDRLVGERGAGSVIFNSTIEKERLFVMVSLAARFNWLDKILKKISHQSKTHQRYPVSESVAKIKNAKLISHSVLSEVVNQLDDGKNIFFQSAQVKTIVSELYEENCRAVIQSLGGLGYDKGSLVEQELRDAIASTIYSGSNEVLYTLISRSSL